MRAGRVVQQGPIDDVWRRPVDPETALFLGYARVLEWRRGRAAGRGGRAAEPPAAVAIRRSALRRRRPAGRCAAPSARRGSPPSRCGSRSTSTASGAWTPSRRSTYTRARATWCGSPSTRTRLAVDPAGLSGRLLDLALVYRRAYVLLVGTALVMGCLAVHRGGRPRQEAGRPRGLPRAVLAAAADAAVRRVPARHAAAAHLALRGWIRARWPEIVRERCAHPLDPRAADPGGDGRSSASTSSTSATGT